MYPLPEPFKNAALGKLLPTSLEKDLVGRVELDKLDWVTSQVEHSRGQALAAKSVSTSRPTSTQKDADVEMGLNAFRGKGNGGPESPGNKDGILWQLAGACRKATLKATLKSTLRSKP